LFLAAQASKVKGSGSATGDLSDPDDIWQLLEHPLHSGLRRRVRDLNTFYRGQPALYEVDFESAGFERVDCGDFEGSVISFLRRAKNPADVTLFICNFTPVPRHTHRVGRPRMAIGEKP
jgi:1,4-alpha-glucan branching enzyme